MVIGALDIATTTGRAVLRNDVFTATSFRARTPRPLGLQKGALSYQHEGRIFREFCDEMRAWLIAEEIEVLGIEEPLRSDVSFRRPIVNMNAGFAGQSISYEERGGTTMNVVFRLYNLVGKVCELCERLNIQFHVVNQSTWRKAFHGSMRPPKGCKDSTGWWKEEAKRKCRLLNIHIPNADAAEAVGIAWWLRGHLNPISATHAVDLFNAPARG